jgi:hypothetical protein
MSFKWSVQIKQPKRYNLLNMLPKSLVYILSHFEWESASFPRADKRETLIVRIRIIIAMVRVCPIPRGVLRLEPSIHQSAGQGALINLVRRAVHKECAPIVIAYSWLGIIEITFRECNVLYRIMSSFSMVEVEVFQVLPPLRKIYFAFH